MCNAAFWEQKRAPIVVSMTTYCKAYVLGMDQVYNTHAHCKWPILPLSNGHLRVTWEPIALTDGECESSCMIKVTLRPSGWWTCPDIVSTNSDDGQCLDSTVWSESRTKFYVESHRAYNYQPESPMKPPRNSEISVTLLPSQDVKLQSIWQWSCWWSNDFSTKEIAVPLQSTPANKSKPSESQSGDAQTE
jgi:hypothetical protein